MVVRVGHKAPVVRVEGTIISRDCVGRFGWNLQLHGKTARSALYLTVKVAGGVARPSTRALRVPSRKIKIRHFSGHIPRSEFRFVHLIEGIDSSSHIPHKQSRAVLHFC